MEKEYFAHESSYIDEGAEIGAGTRIWHFCHIQKGAVIGRDCSLGQNVNIGCNVRIGNGVRIQNNVSVYEGVELEDKVFCGPSCVFTNVTIPRAGFPVNGNYTRTLVKEGASLGANCTIVCGHTVGKCAMIAAGAVVTHDVGDYALMAGVPARQTGWVCECGKKLGRDLRCSCGRVYRLSGGILSQAAAEEAAHLSVKDSGTAGKILAGRLRIIYEDKWLIVVDKKYGLPTISTGKSGELTAYSILYDHVARASRGGRVFIVHRLDRDTSGLLVFAKDEQTKFMLQEDWNSNVLERGYTAVVEGRPEKPDGRIVSWLKENPKSLKMSSSPYDNGGKEAITEYHLVSSRNGLSLVDIKLETGRKNQIRVQFSAMGHPVAGDRKYDAATNPFGRLALHAGSLAFRHPRTGEVLSFSSPAPFRL